MKIVVNKAFIDSETQIGYNEGTIYETDNEERISYLQEAEFLGQTIKGKKKPPKNNLDNVGENNNGAIVNQENPSDDQGESQNE